MSELQAYRDKRDFEKTSEPAPEKKPGQGPLTFVIQKHRATRLHYDLRLEADGVLKSWAVPKGPSLNPADKRLAAMVEDHPLDYASFEGVIPKGEYGAGEVIVWDNGTYSPDEGGRYLFADRDRAEAQMREGIRKGKISFFLRGHKMKGSWTLVKVHGREKDWLLIKHQDEFVRSDYDILTEERSVVTDRSIQDIKDGTAPAPESAASPSIDPETIAGVRKAHFPGFISPMLASIADAPFSNPSWLFEPKLDGYRIIAAIRNSEVTLFSRRGLNVSEKYRPLLMPLAAQPASELVLDGELVAVDDQGRPSFEALQQYLQKQGLEGQGFEAPLVYFVFDILYIDGYDLRDVPLQQRKALLKSILRQTNAVRLVDSFEAEGKTVFEAAIQNGLEGSIGKKMDSSYQSGRRSRDWLKVKTMQTGDFIVAGYTMGEGNRTGSLGALLLGYLDDSRNLVYAGHVGSGFNEDSLALIKERLDRLRSDHCPFDTTPPTNTPATWVKPELVVEVKYSQWTKDGRLRIPVFLRLREDKAPAEARRPSVVEAPDAAPRPSQSDIADDLVERLATKKDSFVLRVDGAEIELKHIDKTLWPATGGHRALTKRDFLTYLAKVSPYLLPHLKDRPLTLSRYPDGINGEHFWQKHWNSAVPNFVHTVNITEETDKLSEYMVCNNLPTLMWLGQAADIEFHTWYSRIEGRPDVPLEQANVDRVLDYPDFIVLDIDPYIFSGKEKPGEEPEFNKNAFDKASQVAKWLKEVLDTLSLAAFVKTSGKTGLHIYIPIARKLEYAAVRRAAETIGRYVMQRHPGDVTMDWTVERRTGKVFIDYNQNVRGKTLASVYSPRPSAEATVSFPLRWDELGKVSPTDFTILTVPDLLKERGDMWGGILDAARDVEKSLGPPVGPMQQ